MEVSPLSKFHSYNPSRTTQLHSFVAEDISNWLWVTFTRSNPAEDIFGLEEGIQNKHWYCRIPIIDARVKPHHAPAMHMPDEIVQMAHQKINNAL